MRSSFKDINLNIFNQMEKLLNDMEEKTSDREAITGKNKFGFVDIKTFVEDRQYMGIKLYPWQMLILKIFYMGTVGNEKLSIPFEPVTEECVNCVWHQNQLNMFKSPCLSCIHCSEAKKQEYFDKEIDLGRISMDEYTKWKNKTKETSNFLSELQMIFKDLTPNEKGDIYEIAKKISTQADINSALVDFEEFEMPDEEFIEEDDDDGSEESIRRKSEMEYVRNQIIRKIGLPFSDLVLVLGRRSGKALAIDTPIITPNGWTTMKDLQVGDEVFGEDGLPTKIIATSEIMQDRPCYELEFSNGDKIIADENHNWSVIDKCERKNSARRRKGNTTAYPKILTTKEISETYICGFHQYNDRTIISNNYSIDIAKPLNFPEKSLNIHPYMLGVWLGDGASNGTRIYGIDKEIFNFLKEYGYIYDVSNSDKITYCLTSKNLYQNLKEYNLIQNKHIPIDFLESSYGQRLDLLRGLLDTDGCINYKGIVEFCATNERLANDVYELITGLGIKCKIKKSDAKLYGRKTSDKYRIQFLNPANLELFKLTRKKINTPKKTTKEINRIYITKVTKLETSIPVKCIQVNNNSNLFLAGKSMIPTHNSLLTSVIALYEAYRFIKLGDPQNYFGLLEGDLITILNVAGSEDQGKDAVFTKIKSLAVNSPFFKKYINAERTGEQSMILLTPNDIEKNKARKEEGMPQLPGSIEIKSGTSKAATQVGKTLSVIIIDEVAEMIKKEDSKMSDSELYNKLKPSLATFGKFGKICVISNPLAKEGILWKLYNNALKNTINPLMFQLPTSLCNPSVEREWLNEQQKDDPNVYEMQYMARFSDGAIEPLIPSVLVDIAFNPARGRALYGTPGISYFAHADPAINNDNYALAVCHVEERVTPNGTGFVKYVIIDHVEIWQPKNSKEKVIIDEVDDYIIDICKKKFNVVSLSYDHFNSATSLQKMQREGIKAIETRFHAQYIEKIYETLLHVMQDNRLEIYGRGQWVPEIKDELLFLQKKYGRRGFRVAAAEGHFDDIPDCIAGAAYMALSRSSFASLPRIRGARLGIDPAERMFAGQQTRRTGKMG